MRQQHKQTSCFVCFGIKLWKPQCVAATVKTSQLVPSEIRPIRYWTVNAELCSGVVRCWHSCSWLQLWAGERWSGFRFRQLYWSRSGSSVCSSQATPCKKRWHRKKKMKELWMLFLKIMKHKNIDHLSWQPFSNKPRRQQDNIDFLKSCIFIFLPTSTLEAFKSVFELHYQSPSF